MRFERTVFFLANIDLDFVQNFEIFRCFCVTIEDI